MEPRNINGMKQVVLRVRVRSHDFAKELLVNFQGLPGLAGLTLDAAARQQKAAAALAPFLMNSPSTNAPH